MRRRNLLVALLAVPLATSVVAISAQSAGAAPTQTADFTVLLEPNADRAAAIAAIGAAGGTVVAENTSLGTMTVSAPAAGFVSAVAASPAVYGAARTRPIGQIPQARGNAAGAEVDKRATDDTSAAAAAPQGAKRGPQQANPGMDPLDSNLWGLSMVRANLAREVQDGDRRVRVGVLDSGVDASHPDLAPVVDRSLSRNFTIDIPFDETGAEIDGPCEFRGCVDPANHDDDGHGTHVAGTIAAAANGFGLSGVAPGVTIVDIRGGQDSGYVFLQPVLDALAYGSDIGLDVINMSFYIDPWLYNCTNNPADSPEAQLEQRTTIAAVQRALNYANRKGVTLVGSLGNNHEDLGKPRPDSSSPDFPTGAAYTRVIDNATCLDLPVEGSHVIGTSALGPSAAKADYSNYGLEQISVSAPGGWFRDGLGTPWYRTNENMILSTHPRNVALANGWIDEAGEVTPAGAAAAVVKHCDASQCAYYRYLQGTSMAAPHATGVSALIVSEYGKRDRSGLTMKPSKVERILTSTAFERPCPTPPLYSYVPVGRPAEFDALCEGTTEFNGFYGHGTVDAFAAVTRGGGGDD